MMIYYHNRKWGSEVKYKPEANGGYETAYVRNVQWMENQNWPEQLEFAGHVFKQHWAIPGACFYVEKHHREKDIPIPTMVEIYTKYHRRIRTSQNEKIRALSFEEWLSITPLKEFTDHISAAELLIDKQGGTWLVTIYRGEVRLRQVEENSMIFNLRILTVREMAEGRKKDLETKLAKLATMVEYVDNVDHIYDFDAYSRNKEKPMSMSAFLEGLLQG